MPLAKSKNQVGLGNSLMNDRFGKGKGHDMRRAKGVVREAPDGSTVSPGAHTQKSQQLTNS